VFSETVTTGPADIVCRFWVNAGLGTNDDQLVPTAIRQWRGVLECNKLAVDRMKGELERHSCIRAIKDMLLPMRV
jgi:hypothetical protein